MVEFNGLLAEAKPIEATSTVVISPKNTLIAQDYRGWLKKATLFLAPLVTMYLAPIIAAINTAVASGTFVPSLALFVPSPLVIGAIILYVLNQITDLINRYIGVVRYKVD